MKHHILIYNFHLLLSYDVGSVLNLLCMFVSIEGWEISGDYIFEITTMTFK